MIQRMVLGVLGGALIALSVFMVGNSVAFDSGVPDRGAAWVVLAAGAVVALFSIVGVRTLIGFGAGAAAAAPAPNPMSVRTPTMAKSATSAPAATTTQAAPLSGTPESNATELPTMKTDRTMSAPPRTPSTMR